MITGPKQLLKEIILLNFEKKINSDEIEEIWNGDKEKEKLEC